MKSYKYLFSVIIPIYNVEDYLEETILSVIDQTIGFQENIQMILVNDGSPDNSEEICLKYKELYPNNVIYVKKKNGGVSSARNEGMKFIEGKYVNFLDSDDKWEKNAFSTAYHFFEKHYEEIDAVAGRMKFFEGSEQFHPLDYVYDNGDRIVDLREHPECIHLHITSSIIKSSIVKKHLFDEKLKYGEDSKYLQEIYLEKYCYGVLKSASFYYRKRSSENSAIQTKNKSLDWYIKTPKLYYDYLLNISKNALFIQFVVMYDLQWRIKEELEKTILPKKEREEYRKVIIKLLKRIDDDVILSQKYIKIEYKDYCFKLKYDNEFYNMLNYQNGIFYYKNKKYFSLLGPYFFRISVIDIKNEELIIGGESLNIFSNEDVKYNIIMNGKKEQLRMVDIGKREKKCMDGILICSKAFKQKLKLNINKVNISFEIQYKNNPPIVAKIEFDMLGRLSRKLPLQFIKHNYCVYRNNNNIIVEPNKKRRNFTLELKCYLRLLKEFKLRPLFYRIMYNLFKQFKKKEIWIISDRTMAANDNGMHLFKYIQTKKNSNIATYFVINKTSKDYKTMKKIGKVLCHGTVKYKIMFLLSNKIVSSQADKWVINAFGDDEKYLRDLYGYSFIFLQHGITKDDISSWLNFWNKNISLFVTAAKSEYKSILENNRYGYDKNNIKLTGFPRYDNLTSKSENIVAIMPTWRQYLSGVNNQEKGIRLYNESFKLSRYYLFYNELINDDDLLKCMRENNCKGIFVVHPSHVANARDFRENDVFEVIQGFANYQDIFKKASLLISDYSSVPFDFAYLHKPIIYSQFDKKEFFSNHLYDEGYFSYEKDGFGPVKYDYESLKKEIINVINKGFVNQEKYEKRINNFYGYIDKNNCKRVYEEIIKR